MSASQQNLSRNCCQSMDSRLTKHLLLHHDMFNLTDAWQPWLIDQLDFISRHWTVYQHLYCQLIRVWVRMSEHHRTTTRIYLLNQHQNQPTLCQKSTEYIDLYEQLYPGSLELSLKFLQLLQEESIQKLFDQYIQSNVKFGQTSNIDERQKQFQATFVERHIPKMLQSTHMDKQMLLYFIREQKSIQKGAGGVFMIKKDQGDDHDLKQTLSEWIAQCKHSKLVNTRLCDMLSVIGKNFKDLMPLNHSNSAEQSPVTQEMRSYADNIQMESISSMECLGCSPYFIEGCNIWDRQVCRSRVAVVGKIRELKVLTGELQTIVVGMMNSNGGVVLFDCSQEYQKIIPYGEQVTERMKEEYEQRLKAYLEFITPEVSREEAVISFVPLLKPLGHQSFTSNEKVHYQGHQRLLKGNQKYQRRSYIKGRYVTRLTIKPSRPFRLYYSFQSKNICNFIIEAENQDRKLKGRQISRKIKSRLRRYYTPFTLLQQQRQMFVVASGFIKHICRAPESGIPINVAFEQKRFVKKAAENEQKYFYASVIFLSQGYLQDFSKRLAAQLNNGYNEPDFTYESPFEKYKFKKAKGATLFYHSARPQNIIKITASNPLFQFNNKQVVIIAMTIYIKIDIFLTTQVLQQVQKWFQGEFPYELLSAFCFINEKGVRQSFLKSESKRSTLFLYYLIDNFGYKALFKNPLHLDKLSEQQRERRFTKIWQSKPQNQLILTQPRFKQKGVGPPAQNGNAIPDKLY